MTKFENISQYIAARQAEQDYISRKGGRLLALMELWVKEYKNLFALKSMEKGTLCTADEVKPYLDGLWKRCIVAPFNHSEEVKRLLNSISPTDIPCPVTSLPDYCEWFCGIFDPAPTLLSTEELLHLLQEEAVRNQCLPTLFLGRQRKDIFPWQSQECEKRYFRFEGSLNERKEAILCLLQTLLMGLPIGNARVSFINLNRVAPMEYIKERVPESLRGDFIFTRQALDEWTQQITKRNDAFYERYGNVSNYLKSNDGKELDLTYELVVTCNDEQNDYWRNSSPKLLDLMKTGHQSGIYFIHCGSLIGEAAKEALYYNLTNWDTKDTLELYHISPESPLAAMPLIEKWMRARKETAEKERRVQQQQKSSQEASAQKAALEREKKDAIEKFEIMAGRATDDNEAIPFSFGNPRAHSFVLGTTGSGKTYFLVSLLMQSMAQYSPDTLQFYLLDLKGTADDYYRFKGFPHVKALLTTSAQDVQPLLMVLRDLQRTMKEREKIRRAHCNDLQEYHAQHPEEVMPRIVVLVDECQNLFRTGTGVDELKMYGECSRIIEEVAKQGRNVGVHLILSTQTLSGTDIPQGILSNIATPIFLKCAQPDILKFGQENGYQWQKRVAQLDYREVYHTGTDRVLQAWSWHNQEESLLQLIQTKWAGRGVEKGYFYDGTYRYTLNKSTLEDSYVQSPIMWIGRTLDVQSSVLSVSMDANSPVGGNLLILGISEPDVQQGLRVLFNSLWSQMLLCRNQRENHRFVLLLNSRRDTLVGGMREALERLENHYGLEIFDTTHMEERTRFIHLCMERLEQRFDDERLIHLFVENMDIDKTTFSKKSSEKESRPSSMQAFGFDWKSASSAAQKSSTSELADTTTEWLRLWERGKECGILTCCQMQKFDRFGSRTAPLRGFAHLVMLRTATSFKGFFDGLVTEETHQLSSDNDRLTACLAENGRNTLFSPFIVPSEQEIDELLK